MEDKNMTLEEKIILAKQFDIKFVIMTPGHSDVGDQIGEVNIYTTDTTEIFENRLDRALSKDKSFITLLKKHKLI